MPSRARPWLACVLALGCLLSQATGCTRRKEVWIYTSLSRDVIAKMVGPLQAAVRDADVRWYQSASEHVAHRIESEIEADRPKADLVMTSDPFWYLEMKSQDRLLPYESPAAREIPASLRDPGNAFVAARMGIMLLAYNTRVLKPGDAPVRWKDLTQPKYEAKVSMGLPLESPPSLLVVAALTKMYGWEYFAELRKLRLVAEGTHSSVLTRIELGERPIGVLPLDVALRAAGPKGAIRLVYPQDGVIPVPGFVAILKDTSHRKEAQKIYDWMLSPAAQAAIVRGGSYSPFPKAAPPEGAPSWTELQAQMLPWNTTVLGEMLSARDRTRAKFSEVVLH